MADLPTIRLNAVTTPPSGVSDGGGRAIASAFSDIARAAANISRTAARREAEAGAEDARKAFDKAASETPAGQIVAVPERDGGLLDILGVRDESYANMLGLLTLQRGEKDAKAEFAALRAETVGRPEEFGRRAGAWVDSYIANAPPESAENLERLLRSAADENLRDVMVERRTLDVREARQGTDAQIVGLEQDLANILDRDGIAGFRTPEFQQKRADLEALLDIKTDDPGFVYSPEERDFDLRQMGTRLQVRAAAATVSDEIKDALDFRGLSAARSRLGELLSSEDFASIPEAERDKLRIAGERVIEEREREIKAAEAEARARQNEFQTSQYQALAISMYDGAAGRADIDLAFEEDRINPSQYLQLLDRYKSRAKERDELIAAQQRFSSGAPLNPASADDRKAVDQVFRAASGEQLLKEDPEAGLDLTLAFAVTKGMIPEAGVSTLRGMIANGSSEQQTFALDSVARLLEEAPAATRREFTDQEIGEAVYYRDLLAAGAPADFVMSSILKAREEKFNPVAQERRKSVAKYARENLTVEKTKKALAGNRPLSGGDAAAEVATRAYRDLFTEFYATSGDAKTAEKQAAEVLKKTYGPSRVLGKTQVMAYPPENYYSVPGFDDSWMQDQLAAEVREKLGDEAPSLPKTVEKVQFVGGLAIETGEAARARDPILDRIQIVSDIQTAAEAQAGEAPSYKIVRTRPDGVLEAMEGRFRFDPSDHARRAMEREKLKDAKALAKAAAMREREASRQGEPVFLPGIQQR